MKFNKIVLLVTLLLATLSTNSFAASTLTLVGGLNSSEANPDSAYLSPDGNGYQAGVLFEAPIKSKLGIEVGALYDVRKYQYSIRPLGVRVNGTVESKGIQIPVAFRLHFLKIFSLGVGGFYEFISSATASARINGTGPTTRATTNVDDSDYGALASLGIHLPLGKKVVLRADARYLYGMTSDKTREIQALAGIGFNFGSMK